MPIYAYRCSSCGAQKDVMQKMSDVPLTVCPECGQATFSKQLTAAGLQFKGSGYHAAGASVPQPACAPCAAAGSCPMAGGN
jgi:putative FmdB family regulatory protein